MDWELVAKVYNAIPEPLRSEWMATIENKVADVSAALTHLLVVWPALDNSTRSAILEEIQMHLADACTMARGRGLFADDDGKNGNDDPVS